MVAKRSAPTLVNPGAPLPHGCFAEEQAGGCARAGLDRPIRRLCAFLGSRACRRAMVMFDAVWFFTPSARPNIAACSLQRHRNRLPCAKCSAPASARGDRVPSALSQQAQQLSRPIRLRNLRIGPVWPVDRHFAARSSRTDMLAIDTWAGLKAPASHRTSCARSTKLFCPALLRAAPRLVRRCPASPPKLHRAGFPAFYIATCIAVLLFVIVTVVFSITYRIFGRPLADSGCSGATGADRAGSRYRARYDERRNRDTSRRDKSDGLPWTAAPLASVYFAVLTSCGFPPVGSGIRSQACAQCSEQ
ncbi:hypothetical protein AK36_604 [Burkholderia vietnamiensis LMG 10929]|nr:hypothetical protein AK36_604 [Burkholderia vietnamiensis LMG 10929]